MSFTLTTLSGALFKAGVDRNTGLSGTDVNLMSDMAEDTFCMKTRYDWVTNFATIDTHIKGSISDAVSDLIAIKIINADMSGYVDLVEATAMVDILKDNYNDIVKDLRDDENQSFNKS